MTWLQRNAPTLEAVAAIITAMVALAALIGVKYQLDTAEHIQRATTARDTFRTHLALAATQSQFAQPDACDLLASDTAVSYMSFVDHLLYSAELMLETEDGWDNVFLNHLTPHAAYICGDAAPLGDTDKVAALLTKFRAQTCQSTEICK